MTLVPRKIYVLSPYVIYFQYKLSNKLKSNSIQGLRLYDFFFVLVRNSNLKFVQAFQIYPVYNLEERDITKRQLHNRNIIADIWSG